MDSSLKAGLTEALGYDGASPKAFTKEPANYIEVFKYYTTKAPVPEYYTTHTTPAYYTGVLNYYNTRQQLNSSNSQ
jgi:hypothetical protein